MIKALRTKSENKAQHCFQSTCSRFKTKPEFSWVCGLSGPLATGGGVSAPTHTRSTGDKFNLTPAPAVRFLTSQGSSSIGTTVRMASSLPRRTTTFNVSSFLTAALTSVAVEIRWPLIEMMTSCSLSPPLKKRRLINERCISCRLPRTADTF